MKQSIFKSLGPGLLYAGAAVGVSHLVQSTRAGATFGISMILIVIIANFLKYPFFEAAPRYASATGKNLLQGYRGLGQWAIWLFLAMTVSTMFIIQAAVTIVTAGLAQNLFGLEIPIALTSSIIILICALILFVGRYKVLEKLMKYIIILLSITSFITVLLSFSQTNTIAEGAVESFDFSNTMHVAFLIAFVGWMPAPIDISVWHSMWALVKNKQDQTDRKATMFDFHFGYWGTAILAIFFVLLGKNMLYGTGIEIAPQAGKFAAQLIGIYTNALGDWSYPIIAIAAFTTMFSTTLTVLDGMSRVMVPTIQELQSTNSDSQLSFNKNSLWIIVIGIGAIIILWFFMKNMRSLVDVATTVSFLTAPVFAILNYLVMQSKDVAPQYRFSKFTKVIALIGIGLLLSTSVYFIIIQVNG